jgi:hypothetical protein
LRTGRELEGNRLLRESLEITDEALADGSENYDHMIDRARVFSIQGDTVQSFQWLQRAFESGWMLDRLLMLDPQLVNLRKDSRFDSLVSGLHRHIGEVRDRLAVAGTLN